MKCYQHYERDAVSSCNTCGRGLCPECTDKYEYPTCDVCLSKAIIQNQKQIQEDKKQKKSDNITIILLTIIQLVVWFLIFIFNGVTILNSLLLSYLISGVIFGWAFLTKTFKFRFNVILFIPIIGWLIYLVFKLCYSALFGFFLTPFEIYKAIKELIKINSEMVNDEKDLLNRKTSSYIRIASSIIYTLIILVITSAITLNLNYILYHIIHYGYFSFRNAYGFRWNISDLFVIIDFRDSTSSIPFIFSILLSLYVTYKIAKYINNRLKTREMLKVKIDELEKS